MWTKLLLDDAKPGEMAKIMKELSPNDTQGPSSEPVDIIAEFLRGAWLSRVARTPSRNR